MWAWVSAFLLGLVQDFPLFSKYFPPNAPEQTQEGDAAAIEKKIADEQSSGRPQ